MSKGHPFTKFLDRAHRRRLAWRRIEHAAIGLLIGCGVCALLLPMLWWRGDEVVGPVAVVLIISSIGGLVAATWRRPPLIDTAMLAERMLGVPELLSSALAVDGTEGFAPTLIALADARVANVSPAAIVTVRLGRRAWSGVALSAATVLTLAMMVSGPMGTSLNRATASAPTRDDWMIAPNRSTTVSSQREVTGGDGSRSDTNRFGSSRDLNAPDESTASSGDASANRDSVAGRASTGSGRSSMESPAQTSARIDDAGFGQADAGTLSTNVDGLGPSQPGAAAGTDRVRGRISDSPEASHAPPWTTAAWSSDRANALQSLRDGRVPDKYRALVRDYFDPN